MGRNLTNSTASGPAVTLPPGRKGFVGESCLLRSQLIFYDLPPWAGVCPVSWSSPCLDDRPSQWTFPGQIPKCEIWKNTGDLLVIVHKVPTNRPAPEFANWGLFRKMCKSPKTQTRAVVVVAHPGGSHLPRFLRSHQHRPQTINNRQSRSTVAISSGQKSQSAIRRSCKKTINSRSGSHRVSGTSLAPGQNVCC